MAQIEEYFNNLLFHAKMTLIRFRNLRNSHPTMVRIYVRGIGLNGRNSLLMVFLNVSWLRYTVYYDIRMKTTFVFCVLKILCPVAPQESSYSFGSYKLQFAGVDKIVMNASNFSIQRLLISKAPILEPL